MESEEAVLKLYLAEILSTTEEAIAVTSNRELDQVIEVIEFVN
jgi:hypothetical protein